MAEDPRAQVQRMLDDVQARLALCHSILHPFEPACRSILSSLKAMKEAELFIKPVPRSTLGYYDVVKQAMSLETIDAKLKKHKYSTLMEFAEDLRLIVKNAHLYNGLDSPVSAMARQLAHTFESLLVSEARMPAPDVSNFGALVAKLPKEKKSELGKLISAYEGLPNGRINIKPSSMKVATQRVCVRFIDEHLPPEARATRGVERPLTPAGAATKQTLQQLPRPSSALGNTKPQPVVAKPQYQTPLHQRPAVPDDDDDALLFSELQKSRPQPPPHQQGVQPVAASEEPPPARQDTNVMKQNRHTQFYSEVSPVRTDVGSSVGGDEDDDGGGDDSGDDGLFH